MEIPGKNNDIPSINPNVPSAKGWKIATLIKSVNVAENIKSLTFTVDGWERHQSGQHYDIRLTSSDGYIAERSYSVASAPEATNIIEFGVQLLPDGEVSPYLWNLAPGQQVEVKGPLGGHFIWNTTASGPLILIAGGSGLVPFISMLRHHFNHIVSDQRRDITLLVSARTVERIPYKKELETMVAIDPKFKLRITLTEIAPPSWPGYTRRIDKEMLRETMGTMAQKAADIYICGPTPFVESTARHMVNIGFPAGTIRTERFGG